MKTLKPSTAPRCAIYLRCSTDDQSFGDYTTIDTQRAYNLERVASLGGELVGEYNDEGRTGTNFARRDWKRLLTDARERKFDRVVVTYMSRLARGEMFHVAEYLLKESRVRVELVQEEFTDDLNGQMNKALKVFLDGNYPRQVSDWTKSAIARRVQMGWHTGGPKRFGYIAETVPGMAPLMLPGGKVKPAPKRLVPDLAEAHAVTRAFEMLYPGHGQIAAVIAYLEEQAPTHRWSTDRVRRLLTDRLYLGESRSSRFVNPAAHPPLTTPERFEATSARLEEIADQHRQQGLSRTALGTYRIEKRVDTVPYYFRGRVFCACGYLLTPAGHHGAASKVGYYQRQNKKAGCTCVVTRINAASLHEAVIEELLRLLDHPTRFDLAWRQAVTCFPKQDDMSAEVDRLRRNLRETGKKLARLVEALKAGVGMRTIAGEIRDLEALEERQTKELEEVRSAIAAGRPKRPDMESLRALWQGFRESWEFLTAPEQTELLELVVGPVFVIGRDEASGGIRVEFDLLLDEQKSSSPLWGESTSPETTNPHLQSGNGGLMGASYAPNTTFNLPQSSPRTALTRANPDRIRRSVLVASHRRRRIDVSFITASEE